MCETVLNHSNANIKRHEKIDSFADKHITTKIMFKVFAFGFDTRIKMISPLTNCLINNAVLNYQSFLQAL